jgi:hypothetical protein
MDVNENDRARWNRDPVLRVRNGQPVSWYEPETKYTVSSGPLYSAIDDGSVALTQYVAQVPLPNQGVGVTNRVGNEIRNVRLRIKGHIVKVSSVIPEIFMNWMALWVVYDRNGDGTKPKVTDMLTSHNPRAFLKPENRHRFEILYETHRLVGPETDGASAGAGEQWNPSYPASYQFNIDIPLGNRRSLFKGPGNAPTNIQAGSFYVVTVGNNLAIESHLFEFETELEFTDA